MAPTAGKRSSIRAKAKSAGVGSLPKPATIATTAFDTGFSNSKRDKRMIKHSSFVSKIEKANSKNKKRRRPSKKLVTDLDSLVSALPDNDDDGDADIQGENETARIRHKSLKSRPGAMKRKDKLERMEMERFSKNMAQMVEARQTQPGGAESVSSAPAAAPTPSSTSDRWAALRGFISQTMEQKPEFKTV